MNVFRSIIAALRGGTPGFAVLEASLLSEVERHLDADRADKLRRRVAGTNLVQRLDGGRQVNAYAIRNGKPTRDESMRLVVEDDERMLATFSFIGANRIDYEGAIWLVKGQFFSIEFNNPTEHALDDQPTALQLSVRI